MRTIKEKHVEQIEKLMQSANKPLTLGQIAKRLRCSRDAARRRLAKLEEETGNKLNATYVREGKRGPESEAYSW